MEDDMRIKLLFLVLNIFFLAVFYSSTFALVTCECDSLSNDILLPLSSEQLVSGSYFYRIFAGERTLASGSFTVIK